MAQTNYERLQSRSIDEMAKHIHYYDEKLNDQICKESESRNGGCNHGDDVTSEDCIACVKRWLESEAE